MMAPSGEKHCRQTLPLDVLLSNLPKNVLGDILVCLPLRDAVRTSILSKKWRYIWSRLPELKLDDTVWMKEDFTYDTSNPRKIIYHILTHHAGPIAKFNLSFPLFRGCPNIDCADIDNLIYFLSRHDLEHLVLSLPEDVTYRLHSLFFTCLQLRHLALRNCLVLPPPTFKGFERLTSLELYDVKISSSMLVSLISSSSLLGRLVVDIPDVNGVIEINAPVLRTFDFRGNLRFLCFKSVPLLSELSLSDEEYFGMDWEAGRDIVKFFQPLSALEHLEVGYMSYFPAGQDLVPTRLPYNLNAVKHFSLCVSLSSLDEVLLTLCLIRSFPFLQYMRIEIDEDKKEDLPALDCLEVESFSDETFDHLREVKLINILGTDRDFQLIQLLLAKSPVLEKMLIELGTIDEPAPARIEGSATVQILAEVAKFPRASTRAEVVYLYLKDYN